MRHFLFWRYNMLDSIRTLIDPPAADDPLIVRADRSAARERRLLLQQAQRRARDCVAQAEAEADLIRAQAFQEGYSQGVLQVAGDLSQLLLTSRLLATELQAQLLQAARELLGEWLMDEQLLDMLVQRWSTRHGAGSPGALQIILPRRCKALLAAVQATLAEQGVDDARISFHERECYLFRQGDQVIELDIEATQQRLAPRLLARLKQLPDSVRELDDASVQLFVEWAGNLNRQNDAPPQVQAESE
jgi:hypothetical protein